MPLMRLSPLACLWLLAAAPAATVPTLAGEARLDGVLDEPQWERAAVLDGFTLQRPTEGARPTERAVLYVWRGADSLWVGWEVESSNHIAFYKRRDQTLYNDDKVEIVLDPTGSGRHGYHFAMNANGSRQDGAITDEGHPDSDWDAFWDGAGQSTPEGWSGEVRIPFRNLEGDPALDSWGFNARVYWASSREDARWAAWEWPLRLQSFSRAGRLEGMAGAAGGASWILRPFVLGRVEDDGGDTVFSGQPGLDALGSLGPWRVSAVANADFGEAEVDSLQSDLSRFGLFFPERRGFFLENAGLFELGPGDARAFHSRRIGLDADAQPVPLRFGAKATTRAGRTDLGVLTAWVDGADTEVYGVGRVRHQISDSATLGAIAVRREAEDEHTTLGADFSWRDSGAGGDRTEAGLFGQTTLDPEGDGVAWGGDVSVRRGDAWAEAGWRRMDAEYDPEVGFFRYRGFDGVTDAFAEAGFEREVGGRIERRSHVVEVEEVRHTSGDLIQRSLGVEPWNLQFANGWNLEPQARWVEARLSDPFSPDSLPGVTIPAGDHSWVEGWLGWFGHFSDYEWVFGGAAGGGGWYDADQVFADGWIQWKATPDLTVGPEWGWSRISKGGEEGTAFVGRLDLTWTPSATRLVKLTVQRDEGDDVWVGNLRSEWRPRDGEATFLVANFAQEEGADDAWQVLVKREWILGP